VPGEFAIGRGEQGGDIAVIWVRGWPGLGAVDRRSGSGKNESVAPVKKKNVRGIVTVEKTRGPGHEEIKDQKSARERRMGIVKGTLGPWGDK